jgi:AcrR family transcriptional regulator
VPQTPEDHNHRHGSAGTPCRSSPDLHFVSESAILHFVDESADLRTRRRQLTSQLITTRAQQLTEQRGLDGFTMDELAAACDVSRRTLFNYYPSKLDAVLGAVPELDPGHRATFLAGGPRGQVFDDLGALGRTILDVAIPDREALALGRRVLTADPRLLVAVHTRFEQVTAAFELLVLDREGPSFGAARARLLVRMVLAVFDTALDGYVTSTPERPMVAWYDATLADARTLFA